MQNAECIIRKPGTVAPAISRPFFHTPTHLPVILSEAKNPHPPFPGS